MIFSASLLAALAVGAPNIDTTNQQAVTSALRTMVDNLMAYYNAPGASSQGTINPNTNSDASGFQWYEGGIMWGVLSEYMKTTGDLTHATTVVNALTLASYGEVGSFLGTNEVIAITLEGKWNDDILWWALGPSIFGEMFGKDVLMPGGVSYFDLADKTYQQVQAQYDDQCQGGLWWSRDRGNPKSGGYKSTITQNQQMVLGAQLALMTGNTQYLQEGAVTYQWMKNVGIIAQDWTIYDGLDVNQNCGINGAVVSYKSGFLTGALGWMYRATDQVEYINDAHAIFEAGRQRFAANGILTDPCEEGNQCAQNQVSAKGTMVRGWGYLAEFTNSPQIRANLRAVLKSSVDAMLNTCDDNFNCGNRWSTQQFTSSNVHYQMNSIELMTAYLKTFTEGPAGGQSFQSQAPTAAPSVAVAPNSPQGGAVPLYNSFTFIIGGLMWMLV